MRKIEIDEIKVSKAIIETYMKDLLEATETDVAIAGAGPAGMTAAYYLAKEGVKTAIFERKLCLGGGMWGGGMMFPCIVVQEGGRGILDEFDVPSQEYEEGYWVADAIEAVSTIASRTIMAGARIFNLIRVEDVMIREKEQINGLVLNWSAVGLANLHVDPLTIRSKVVVDATDTKEVYPGLIVAGMAANAVFGSPRMGAIFGGMLLSGKKAAELILDEVLR